MSTISSFVLTLGSESTPTKSKPARTLESIEADIDGVNRKAVFQLGKLLTEAKGLCDDKEWETWLRNEFHMPAQTAANYMAAWRLVSRLRQARSLNVAARVITAAAWLDKTEQTRAVAVLAKAATNKRIGVSEGYKLLDLVRREAFLQSTKKASRLASYHGPFDKTVANATRQAALAWTRVATTDEPDGSSNPLVCWWQMADPNQRAEFISHVREIPKPINMTIKLKRKPSRRRRNVVGKRTGT